MGRGSDQVGRYVAGIFGGAMIVAGIAGFVIAGETVPTDPHHGSAVDGLDGLATFAALVAAAIALVLLVIGGLLLRTALRGPRATRLPPPPPPIALPTARARNVPPSRQ